MIVKTIQATVILGLLSSSLLAEKRQTVEQLFGVQTVKVKKEQRASVEKNYGFVAADQSRMYEIAPRYGGYVVKLYANKIYQRVKKGDALVTLYSPEVLKAKDEYLNSYRFNSNSSNKGMLDSAKRKLELLGIDPREIRDVIKKKKSSATSTIYAPADGYIFTKNINHGSAFRSKQKLFTLLNIDKVWVEAKVRQEQTNRLAQIDHYKIHVAPLAKVYKTDIGFLYPHLNVKEALMTLRLNVTNPDHKLFPGMYASVESVSKSQTYLTLPSTAVARKNGRYYSFIVGEYEGEYEPLVVDVIPLDDKTYIIKSGLKEGDEVVNNALFMMDSDAQVNGLY